MEKIMPELHENYLKHDTYWGAVELAKALLENADYRKDNGFIDGSKLAKDASALAKEIYVQVKR